MSIEQQYQAGPLSEWTAEQEWTFGHLFSALSEAPAWADACKSEVELPVCQHDLAQVWWQLVAHPKIGLANPDRVVWVQDSVGESLILKANGSVVPIEEWADEVGVDYE